MKMSTAITTTKMSEELHSQSQSTRYQQLKQRKEALEKKLNEKYEQLHQICQKEATLIGNNLDLIPSTTQSTLRKRVGTSFKLPDQNFTENEELNKLLMQRQVQQQISQASFRIANDPLQSKSIRRTHKHSYEASQVKISQINEMIQRQHARPVSQDDIDLHRSDNRYVKNALAMVGNNMKNLHILNSNNPMSERRNSMKSTTSSLGSQNTFIVQASPSSASSLTSLKTIPNNGNMSSPRLRPETGNRFEYDFHPKNESPTPSNFSLQNPQIHQPQIPLCSQSLKNIKINTGDSHSICSQDFYNNFATQQSQYMNGQQQFQHSPQGRPENKFIHRLHSFQQQFQHDMQNHLKAQMQEDMRLRQLQKTQTLNNHHSPNHYTPAHSAGLGGYWTINENNQRIWVSDKQYPLSPPPVTNMSKKSNSLGNFDFMHKHEMEQHDSVSISSGNSNEHKKKEKVWCETSLDIDTPAPEPKQYRPRIESPTTNDIVNNNHQIYENMHSPQSAPAIPQHFQNFQNGHMKVQGESIYLNPLANANQLANTNPNPPNIPPKSKLRYSESTRSTISNRDIENNIIPHIHHNHMSPTVQVESPKNVTIIQEGSWQPYKEEIKSYEISDFYKYSQKYRQQQQQQKQQHEC